MKIAIEAQRIFRTNKHGMDFVALESIRELQKIDKENEYFIFVSPGEDHCLEETSNTHIVEVKCPTYPLWEQVALPRAVAKIRPDLLHCTSNTAPIHCPVPLVLTLHDIIFLEPKQGGNTSWYQNMGWHYRRLVVPRILPKCKRIITVSHFERDRIREALCLPKEQIMAIYNGYSQHFHPLSGISAITHKYIHSDDYLFFLGNTDPKKNVPRTLKAYSLYLKRSSRKRPLLIADLREDKLDMILREQHIEEIKPYLSYPGYISNKDLAAAIAKEVPRTIKCKYNVMPNSTSEVAYFIACPEAINLNLTYGTDNKSHKVVLYFIPSQMYYGYCSLKEPKQLGFQFALYQIWVDGNQTNFIQNSTNSSNTTVGFLFRNAWKK